MINPVNGKVRVDNGGSGYFGAPRGDRQHKGVDLECDPGQQVRSPISGTLVRVAYPYQGDTSLAGVVVASGRITVKMFYMQPDTKKIGKRVDAGEVIGTAQDVRTRYGYDSGLLPHIHLEIAEVDPLYFLDMP